MTPSTTQASSKLALLPEADVRILPKLHRSMDKVDDRLRDVFRDLITGKAPWPLFLHGPSGSGKTCAALALLDRSTTAAYFTTGSLISEVLALEPSERGPFWDWLGEKQLAVLDEIGIRSKVTDLEYDAVHRIADIREQCSERRAVYVSNLAPDAIRKLFDDRVFSRLTGGTIFKLSGVDRRRSR